MSFFPPQAAPSTLPSHPSNSPTPHHPPLLFPSRRNHPSYHLSSLFLISLLSSSENKDDDDDGISLFLSTPLGIRLPTPTPLSRSWGLPHKRDDSFFFFYYSMFLLVCCGAGKDFYGPFEDATNASLRINPWISNIYCDLYSSIPLGSGLNNLNGAFLSPLLTKSVLTSALLPSASASASHPVRCRRRRGSPMRKEARKVKGEVGRGMRPAEGRRKKKTFFHLGCFSRGMWWGP